MARNNHRKIFIQQFVRFETMRTLCRRWIIAKELSRLQQKYVYKAVIIVLREQTLLDKHTKHIQLVNTQLKTTRDDCMIYQLDQAHENKHGKELWRLARA